MADSLSRQIKTFIRAADEQGFRTRETKKGVMIYAKNGEGAVLLHLTPSDKRGVKNARARLRGIGVSL